MTQSTETRLNSFQQSTLICHIFTTSQPIYFIFILKESSFFYDFIKTKEKQISWLVIKILQINVDDFKTVKPGFCRRGHIYVTGTNDLFLDVQWV